MRRSFSADQKLVKARVLIVLPGEDRLLTVPNDDLSRGEDLTVSHHVARQRRPISPAQHDVKVSGLARESSNQRADLEMFPVGDDLESSVVTRPVAQHDTTQPTHLVIPVSRSVTGQAEGCSGQGAAAGEDEGGLQSVLLDVAHQGGLELRPRSQSEWVDGEGAGTGADSPD